MLNKSTSQLCINCNRCRNREFKAGKKIRKEAAPLKIQKQRLETKESMNMHENTKRKKTGMAVDVQRNFPAWLLG